MFKTICVMCTYRRLTFRIYTKINLTAKIKSAFRSKRQLYPISKFVIKLENLKMHKYNQSTYPIAHPLSYAKCQIMDKLLSQGTFQSSLSLIITWLFISVGIFRKLIRYFWITQIFHQFFRVKRARSGRSVGYLNNER